mmetsp:Transcript_15000/g.50314  ORF Transcript_15000/g.50314 Transcript_15000/m.50314 type:complete len:264 (+) Transcript_15000:583-1374(+)
MVAMRSGVRVAQSTTALPGPTAERRPGKTASEASSVDSIEYVTAQASTTAAGVAAMEAKSGKSATMASALAASRFQTTTSRPARRRRRTMPFPMMPTPTKPTCAGAASDESLARWAYLGLHRRRALGCPVCVSQDRTKSIAEEISPSRWLAPPRLAGAPPHASRGSAEVPPRMPAAKLQEQGRPMTTAAFAKRRRQSPGTCARRRRLRPSPRRRRRPRGTRRGRPAPGETGPSTPSRECLKSRRTVSAICKVNRDVYPLCCTS